VVVQHRLRWLSISLSAQNKHFLLYRTTPCLRKKFPPLNCPQLCQILTDFQNFCTAGKRMKFATKHMRHYPPHLRYVATLPPAIKVQIFCRCGRKRREIAFLIASNFVIHPQILIFLVFKIASLSPYWLQIKLSVPLFFYMFTFAINLWHRKYVTADVTAVLVNNQHGIQQRGQDFDKKSLYLKGM